MQPEWIYPRPVPVSSKEAGFSLVMVSIILTAAAIALVAMLPGADETNAKKAATTRQRMLEIELSTRNFMTKNGRRPCPADGQYAQNTTNFGVEAANSGTCTGGTPAAPLGADAGTGYIVGGTVPTKTLNLDDSYAFDGWGRRITYIVDRRATEARACQSLQNYPMNSGKGGIKIDATTGGTNLDNVMAAYISHGQDGQGAFPSEGSAVADRIITQNTDADKLTNAGTDSSFNYDTAHFTNEKIWKEPTSSFADILYYMDSQKNTCCMGSSCMPTGFAVDSVIQNVVSADVNGDGIDDLIFDVSNSGGGYVYIVFGKKTAFPALSDITTPGFVDGVQAASIYNDEFSNGLAGYKLATGDLNGDGIRDIIINAPAAKPDGSTLTGTTWVVFGRKTWPAQLDTSTLDGTNGVRIDGTIDYSVAGQPTYTGSYAYATGDVNGDGIDDLIIGVTGHYSALNTQQDEAYVVFGKRSGWSSPMQLGVGHLDGTNGTTIQTGTTNSKLGRQVAVLDFNGDKKKDIYIAAPGGYSANVSQPNTAYLVFNKTSAWPATLTLSGGTLDGTTATQFTVTDAQYFSSLQDSVAAGDFNNDGYDDIALFSDALQQVEIFNGRAGPFTGTTSVDPTVFINMNMNNSSPSLAAGDVNGDYIADLIVGLSKVDSTGSRATSGTGYVIFGGGTPFTSAGTYNTSSFMDGSKGFSVYGAVAGGLLGSSVAVGDVNGNGIKDVLFAQTNRVGSPKRLFGIYGRTSGWSSYYDAASDIH